MGGACHVHKNRVAHGHSSYLPLIICPTINAHFLPPSCHLQHCKMRWGKGARGPNANPATCPLLQRAVQINRSKVPHPHSWLSHLPLAVIEWSAEQAAQHSLLITMRGQSICMKRMSCLLSPTHSQGSGENKHSTVPLIITIPAVRKQISVKVICPSICWLKLVQVDRKENKQANEWKRIRSRGNGKS